MPPEISFISFVSKTFTSEKPYVDEPQLSSFLNYISIAVSPKNYIAVCDISKAFTIKNGSSMYMDVRKKRRRFKC